MRKLSYTTLILAFAQIVFGAIVRITGSGLGCGDHWPKCHGEWFPPHDRIDLIIEITHRYIAAALTVAIVVMLWQAIKRKNEVNVLKQAVIAMVLVVTAALFGAVTVKMDLNPFIVATHLGIAMLLLAVLASIVVNTGGFGAARLSNTTAKDVSRRTFRSARAATIMTFAALLLGALTANIPGAAVSCGGFPLCRTISESGFPLWIQVIHRVIAFLLFFHLFGMGMVQRKRGDHPVIKRAVWIAFGSVLLQLLVAAAMIEMHFPIALRSLHQAVGTLAWLSVFTLTALTERGLTKDGKLSIVS